MREGRHYSIGRHYSVRDWCRNVLERKQRGGVCPKSLDYGQHSPQMNWRLIDQVHFSGLMQAGTSMNDPVFRGSLRG